MNDLVYIFEWWLLFLFLGIINLPFTRQVLSNFFDKGYAFSKILSSLFITFFVFLIGIFRIYPFNTSSILFSILIVGILNLLIIRKGWKDLGSDIQKNIFGILTSELLFLFGLMFWSIIRGFHPDINGLEKFMDYGFINSILRSEYLPPVDMWHSGNPINYYWFGHLWIATITKISGITSDITYNLMIATIAGFTMSGAFSIVSTLASKIKGVNSRSIFAAGLISATLLTFAGNFHTPYYYLKNGVDKYWYPDATRFIGYNPDINDKTIHEFPIYSFVVSDLHAHLINLPLVILFVGLLLAYYLERGSKKEYFLIVIIGWMLGLMFMVSTWDFGNYLIATSAVVGMKFLVDKKYDIKSIMQLGGKMMLAILVAGLTIAPFLLNFHSIAEGVALVKSRTPVWQLSILWGFPFILTVIFILVLLHLLKKKRIESQDYFVFAILITAWTLILLPEIIYLRDIYEATHHRANTMFKLTYQAYVLTYMMSGYIGLRLVRVFKSRILRFASVVLIVSLFTLVMLYPSNAIKSFYGNLEVYKTLSGENWMKIKYPDEYKALQWLRENVDGQPVILEAPGDSYTEFNIISSYSGLPTVNGWFVHEWLWRGDSSIPQARNIDIDTIYTSKDIQRTNVLIDQYDISYILFTTNEYAKYLDTIETKKFDEIGKLIFESGKVKIFKVNL